MELAIRSKCINKLRKALKLFNMRQPKGCKKNDLIRLLTNYLNNLQKQFIENPKRRAKIKKVLPASNREEEVASLLIIYTLI